MVICPKCKAENASERESCTQCGAKLLPGRSIRERIGYLIGGIAAAALSAALAWLFARMELTETLPECCGSPLYLALLALGSLIGGLALAFGRTPEYEKHVREFKSLADPKECGIVVVSRLGESKWNSRMNSRHFPSKPKGH